MKDGGSRYVGPPARVLGEEEWTSSRGTKKIVLMLESPLRGKSIPLSDFRKKIKSIETKLDHPNPQTIPIPRNDVADKILRFWTTNGRIAK
jgi:hypothetical protein